MLSDVSKSETPGQCCVQLDVLPRLGGARDRRSDSEKHAAAAAALRRDGTRCNARTEVAFLDECSFVWTTVEGGDSEGCEDHS